jgi:predicted esterase
VRLAKTTSQRFSGLMKDAAACAEETIVIRAGKSVDATKPTPLIVMLQGLGCGPRSEIPYWEPAADQLGLILVAPRGVTKVGSMMYGWHRSGAKDSSAQDYFDIANARKRPDDAIALAQQKFKIDRKRMVLAGFSQGGAVALRMLGERPENFCGTVAVCSLCQSLSVTHWREISQKQAIRVSIMAGKLDRLLPRSQQAVEQLRTASLATQYEEVERMGHEYPPDYTDRLRRSIEFVLK